MSKIMSDSGTTQTAWNQLDQLLNCAICLDRYRNPKLLPCQHTFCMEPCLEGLIDYIRRQIKCPECRAEHRIPYQGIQGYPTNVTLMRFLELHFEVTGETPDPTPSVRERCGVCSEKAYLAICYHCEKKVCPDCKEAHLDILKREIARINNQIRRGLHRLQDALSQSEKSVHLLQQNCCNVTQEIEEVYARLQKELKEREEILKNEVALFLQAELRNLTQLKENLDIEVANIQSNCELAEKHVNENSEWEDVELVDYKDTFLKTLEFVRNFDSEQAEFNGRLKFQGGPESDTVHTSIANFGELVLNCPQYPTNTPSTLASNLMRSKSDHRLATQFHRQEENRNYLGVGQRFADTETKHDGRSTSPISRRSTDYRRNITDRARELDEGERFGSRRYTREFGGNWQREDTDAGGYRSRYARDDLREGSDPDVQGPRGVRFAKHEQPEATPRERIFDTEDAIKGPLSGIARLMDCPRVIRKLQLNEQHQKQKLEEKSQPTPPVSAPVPAPTPVAQQPVRRTQRQASEDDEIAKIKAQNKNTTSTQTSTNTTSTMTTTTASEPPSRPLARRVAALQNKDEVSRPTVQLNRSGSREDRSDSTSDQSPSSPTQMGRRRTGSRQEETSSEPTTPKTVTKQTSRDTSTSRDSTPSRPPSRQVSRDGEYKTPPSTPTRKLSTDQRSDTSNDESSVAAKRRFFTRNQSDSRFERPNLKSTAPTPIAETPKTSSESDSDRLTSAESTPVVEETKGQDAPNYFRFKNSNHSRTPSTSSVDDSGKSPSSPGSPLFARGRPEASKANEEENKERARSSESSSSTASSSSESSSNSSPSRSTPPVTVKAAVPKREEKPDETSKTRFPSGSTSTRETASTVRPSEPPKVDGRNSPSTNRSNTPSYSSRTSSLEKQDEPKEKPKFVSRFLPRQSSSVENKDESSEESESESEQAAKEAARDASITALLARSALARRESTGSALSTPSASSSSTRLYGRDRDDTSASLTLRKPSSYLHSRDDKKDTDGAESRYSSLSSKYLTRGRSTLDDDKDDKYGSYASRYLARSKSSAALSLDRDVSPERRTGSDRFRKESRFSALRRNRLGRSRSSHDIALHGDDDDDDRDVGTTSYRSSRFDSSSDLARSWSHHALSREQSPEDMSAAAIKSWAKYLKNKYGSKIKEQKSANRDTNCNSVNDDDSSDSSDDDGGPLTSVKIGSKLELSKSTTSLNLNIPTGENPRTTYLQKRRMIAKLGTRGSEPGCFTWPRGVAVGPENSIVVADSSNHRIQVFDCCGNFIKEFGSYGNAEGEFDCLAGVAVNRIGQYIISDRYNHRIQVFDPTGRFLRVFGNQGSSDGRFSYPWGVSTDSLGFIYVCDKENNRVQVFQSDGTFVGKFGTFGNKVGQLEHPHYIAVSNTNKVVVSDGNNHRISIFDVNGRSMFCFGSEGAEEGQFKFPRGVAVDDQGYIIVGDSGNNRIQIFNSDGTFLRSFGAWGSGDGEFKGLEGVAVTSNGNVLVCDRENHRIQIF